jgi:hypothetical protein
MASMHTTNNYYYNNSMQDEKENRVLNHRLGDVTTRTNHNNGTRRHNQKPQSSPQNGVPSSLTKLEVLKQRLQVSRNQRASASLVSSTEKPTGIMVVTIHPNVDESTSSSQDPIAAAAAAEREKNKKNQTATTTTRDKNQFTPVKLNRESQPNPYETAAPLLSATHSTNTTFRDLFGSATEKPDAKKEEQQEQIMERLSPTTTTSTTTTTPIRKSVSFAAAYESTVAPIETAFQHNDHTVIVDVEGGTSTNTKLTMNHYHHDHDLGPNKFTKAYLLLVCLGVVLLMRAGAAIGVAVNAAFFG